MELMLRIAPGDNPMFFAAAMQRAGRETKLVG
jgi:hypothetical protein